jgi:hypothetical protein
MMATAASSAPVLRRGNISTHLEKQSDITRAQEYPWISFGVMSSYCALKNGEIVIIYNRVEGLTMWRSQEE